MAKIFLKISLKIASNSINKNHKNKNDPNMKMVIQMVKEAPVETIVNFSGGKFEQRFVNMIIKSANKK